mmetsp:Transcript_80237/g.215575  ORF Transcript_80237/g.215575 Transcript_80237/m.215575 type:complete len:203 (+) Transcript_80237:70-678(+)
MLLQVRHEGRAASALDLLVLALVPLPNESEGQLEVHRPERREALDAAVVRLHQALGSCAVRPTSVLLNGLKHHSANRGPTLKPRDEVAVLRRHVAPHGHQVRGQRVLRHGQAQGGVEGRHDAGLRAGLSVKALAAPRTILAAGASRRHTAVLHAIGQLIRRPALHEDPHAHVIDVRVAPLFHAPEYGHHALNGLRDALNLLG